MFIVGFPIKLINLNISKNIKNSISILTGNDPATKSTSNQLCKLLLLTFLLDNLPIKIINVNISKNKCDFTFILTGCHSTMT